LTHIDIQIAGLNDIIRMKLPVIYEGRNKLESSGLLLVVYVSEVIVHGIEKDIPESIIFDVSDKRAGDVINASMITLNNGVKLLDGTNEVLAVVSEPKRVETEVEDQAAPSTVHAE
jgi:large subunit ribosomal protein L25